MKIAYLVLAHNNPRLLKRTIERLSCEHSAFFIHIDQKCNINQFSEIRGEDVHFIDQRMPVYWGEFSQVQAILMLVRQALNGSDVYDYLVLISGSDYPLRSSEYIHTFFEENRGSEFISLVKVPAPGKPLSRIRTLRFPSHKPIRRFVARVLAKLGLAQRDYRKYLGGLEPDSGNTWWALTREACRHILKFTCVNKNVVEYFQNTFASDEAFFHTILGNSPFASRIRRNLVYEDWSAQGPHPATINEQHLVLFEAHEKMYVTDMYGSGEVLFARKFSDASLDLLQRIHHSIEQKERNLTSSGHSLSICNAAPTLGGLEPGSDSRSPVF